MATRECGECSACCTRIEISQPAQSVPGIGQVPAFIKPANETCQHLGECGGCAIHSIKPTVCREFKCGWLNDPNGVIFGVEDRPDKINAIFGTVARPNLTAPEGLWRCFELEPDAGLAGRPRAIIQWLLDRERAVTILPQSGSPRMVVRSGSAFKDGGAAVMAAAQKQRDAQKEQS